MTTHKHSDAYGDENNHYDQRKTFFFSRISTDIHEMMTRWKNIKTTGSSAAPLLDILFHSFGSFRVLAFLSFYYLFVIETEKKTTEENSECDFPVKFTSDANMR